MTTSGGSDLSEIDHECCNCGAEVSFCANRMVHESCNGAVERSSADRLCLYCSFNRVIPDVSIRQNLLQWRRLEAAKHRVLYEVERLGLPLENVVSSDSPALRFEFKSSHDHPVSTGHASGLITIDIAEADSVHREKTRVEFGEPQRTLVGHFRHELGHFYWELLVANAWLNEFRQLFGDEQQPAYQQAQQKYYEGGPRENWQDEFVSGYASMHPWEDFAETFATYLDMAAIVSTATHFNRIKSVAHSDDFPSMLNTYLEIGVVANEFNRDMGLLDLVPEVFNDRIVEKLRFVHEMRMKSKRLQTEENVQAYP